MMFVYVQGSQPELGNRERANVFRKLALEIFQFPILISILSNRVKKIDIGNIPISNFNSQSTRSKLEKLALDLFQFPIPISNSLIKLEKLALDLFQFPIPISNSLSGLNKIGSGNNPISDSNL